MIYTQGEEGEPGLEPAVPAWAPVLRGTLPIHRALPSDCSMTHRWSNVACFNFLKVLFECVRVHAHACECV